MNTLCRPQTTLTIVLTAIIGLAVFALPTPHAAANSNCPLTFDKPADVFEYTHDGTLEFSEFQRQNGQAVITVTNNSDCELPLALGSYKMMSGNQLSEQQLHDEHKQVVPAQSSRTLQVTLPSCMTQIDLYHDPGQDGVPTPPEPANTDLIGFTFSGNEEDTYAENDMFHFEAGHPYEDLDNFPNDDDDSFENAGPSDNFCPADQPDPLSGSCDVSPDNASPEETVTWTADASGGTTPYTYQWNLENSDDDSNQKTVTTNYSSSGSFDGTVTITDNQGDSINRTCTVDVTENGDDDDDGKGGGGAILDPRDDGEVRGDQDEDFSVQCNPENDKYLIGEPVLFTAEVNGDIDEDDVAFNWSSDDNFKSENNQAAVQYVSAGTKSTVSVTAEYDNREETATCNVTIRQAASQNSVRLDRVPYTGPSDTARTVAFSVFVLLIALSGSYYALRRFREDAVAVGIPEDGA